MFNSFFFFLFPFSFFFCFVFSFDEFEWEKHNGGGGGRKREYWEEKRGREEEEEKRRRERERKTKKWGDFGKWRKREEEKRRRRRENEKRVERKKLFEVCKFSSSFSFSFSFSSHFFLFFLFFFLFFFGWKERGRGREFHPKIWTLFSLTSHLLFHFFFEYLSFFFTRMQRVEQLLFFLLLKMDIMNKLFNFSWKKKNQMLILQIRCYFVDCVLFLFFFFFTFSFFYFFFLLMCKGWKNSSFYCCSKWTWTNCSNFIGKRKSKCWSCRSGVILFDCVLFLFFFFSLSHFSIFFLKGWKNSSLYCYF